MTKKVAALLQDGMLTDFAACTHAAVFEQQDGAWQMVQEIPYDAAACTTSEDIRSSVRSLILELGDCSVVVARRLQGLPYHVFDRMGFQIFEAETLSDALLTAIFIDISDAEQKRLKEPVPTAPMPMDERGRYRLDLIALQEQHPEISSKQALRPFLQSTPFYELHLVCSHLPPWLEEEAQTRRLRCVTESQPNGTLHVTLTRSLC